VNIKVSLATLYVLEEHIIVDFSQTEIFWRIVPYIINLGKYIEIPFCVIMNLKQ
jgi:hypothetical protein